MIKHKSDSIKELHQKEAEAAEKDKTRLTPLSC